MKFLNLDAQYERIKDQVNSRITRVLNHGHFIMGDEVAELEECLAEFVGARYCVGVGSGTEALLIALMGLGISPGDEVITTPFTFIATGEVIALLGAKPVYVDVDTQTYNIDPKLIPAAITEHTKAIIAVSLYGQPADFDAINVIAEPLSIPVIEDGAQSFGAEYKGKRSCGLSTIGCTSFFPSKPLGCYGDGGALFTDDEELAQKARQIRVHGQDRRYHHARLGINGRLDTLQAAVLLAKMKIFESEVEARVRVGQRYSALLEDDGLVTPYIAPHVKSVYGQYTVQVNQREDVQDYLQSKNIPTAVHYPLPLYRQPALAQEKIFLRETETLSKKVLSLPMHPYMEESEQEQVAECLLSAMKNQKQ